MGDKRKRGETKKVHTGRRQNTSQKGAKRGYISTYTEEGGQQSFSWTKGTAEAGKVTGNADFYC